MIGAMALPQVRLQKFLRVALLPLYRQLEQRRAQWVPGLLEMASQEKSQCKSVIISWESSTVLSQILIHGCARSSNAS
jgi:hypothetical protein